MPFPRRRRADLGIGAVGLVERSQGSGGNSSARYLRHLEEQFAKGQGAVHHHETSRHGLLDPAPAVGDSDIDNSPSNPSAFLLDGQTGIGWQGPQGGR